MKNPYIFLQQKNFLFKRIIDLSIAIPGAVITLLFFPIITLIIKLDSRFKLYLQRRIGLNNREFTIYKFRTLTHGSDQKNTIWRELDKKQITRVGRFLRITNIDEFPQFLNVIIGGLSIVGPRPEWIKLVRILEKQLPDYSERYKIKPGITGLAQIMMGSPYTPEEIQKKIEYDLYYIKNFSISMDIKILMKTIVIVFKNFAKILRKDA